MSRVITLCARLATRRHRREDRRADAFVTAIRATAPAPATTPLRAVTLGELAAAAAPAVELPTAPIYVGRRTDTALVPRIILTAAAPL